MSKHIRRGIAALLFLFGMPMSHARGWAGETSEPIYETVLFNTVIADIAEGRTLKPDTPAVRAAIESFRKRAGAFRSRLPRKGGPAGPFFYVHEKRIELERGMVALIPGKGIEALAAGFAGKIPIAYEWEGMSDGPLREAAFGEEFLASHPKTKLAAYLNLFVAHRMRSACETLCREKKEDEAGKAWEKYKRYLGLALADPLPLVRFTARDMDQRPFLYLDPGPCHAKDSTARPDVPQGRCTKVVRGEIRKGEAFTFAFGPGLVFRLSPMPLGWMISVHGKDGGEDLSRLTPPLHFAPNPRYIEGWNFRNSDNTGPNGPGEKNVNAPQELRGFIFSPELPKDPGGQGSTPEEAEKIGAYGKGSLFILEYRLNNFKPGEQAGMEWMRFEVTLSWPDSVRPKSGKGPNE